MKPRAKADSDVRMGGAVLVAMLTLAACSKSEPPVPTRQSPAVASSAAASTGAATYPVLAAGSARFLIDAPLEKIKGESTHFRGSLTINPSNLVATHGEVDVDLDQLKTATFDDANKNSTQTGHAHNWLELGSDVDPEQRAENQWARFTLVRVETANVNDLSIVKPLDGKIAVELKAEGNLWLHGVNAKKNVRLNVSFEGPAAAPSRVVVKTIDPLRISLREHDIKPRDIAGKFLQGGLEKVGQKIDDQVQISLAFSAAANGNR